MIVVVSLMFVIFYPLKRSWDKLLTNNCIFHHGSYKETIEVKKYTNVLYDYSKTTIQFTKRNTIYRHIEPVLNTA